MGETIIIAAGGTGGHIFPAQELAKTLLNQTNNLYDVVFVAKGLSANKHFKRNLYNSIDIDSCPVSLHPLTLLKAVYYLPKGTLQALSILKKQRPKLVIGFGSYHTVPVLVAALMLSIPIILHEANSIPGRVNRLFSPYAEWTGVFFPQAEKYLKGIVKQVDIPLKKEFSESKKVTRNEALSYFGLDPEKKTLLIFGGSQGAQAINTRILDSIHLIKAYKEIQVIHLTGSDEMARKSQEVLGGKGVPCAVKIFEPHMYFAWAACDFCIARSGASTIAEQIAYAVPALFIPYPHAQDNHQEINALWMQNSIGAAKVLKEQEATSEEIAKTVDEILFSDTMLKSMKSQLIHMQKTLAPCAFSQQILEYLHGDLQ